MTDQILSRLPFKSLLRFKSVSNIGTVLSVLADLLMPISNHAFFLMVLPHSMPIRPIEELRRIGDDMYQYLFSLSTTADAIDGEHCGYSVLFDTHCGVLVSSTLHWIVYNTNDWERITAGFDLALETFDKFPHPDLLRMEAYWDEVLCVMEGCLPKSMINMRDDAYIHMLRSPGIKDSIGLFTDMNLDNSKDLVGFARRGQFFITAARYGKCLGLVEPRSWSMKYYPLTLFASCGDIQIANYVPCLISPFTTA